MKDYIFPKNDSFDSSEGWITTDGSSPDVGVAPNSVSHVSQAPSRTLQPGESMSESSPKGCRNGGPRRGRRLVDLLDLSGEDSLNKRVAEIRGDDGMFSRVLVVSDSTTKFRESLYHSRQVRRVSKEKYMGGECHVFPNASPNTAVTTLLTRNGGGQIRRAGSAPNMNLNALSWTKRSEQIVSSSNKCFPDHHFSDTMEALASPPSPLHVSPKLIFGSKGRTKNSGRGSFGSDMASCDLISRSVNFTQKSNRSSTAVEAFPKSFSSLGFDTGILANPIDSQNNGGGEVQEWNPHFSLDNVRDFNLGQGGFSHSHTSASELGYIPFEFDSGRGKSSIDSDGFIINVPTERRQNRRRSMSGRIDYTPETQQQVTESSRRSWSSVRKERKPGGSKQSSRSSITNDNESNIYFDELVESPFGNIGSNDGFKESPLDFGFNVEDFDSDFTTETKLSNIVRTKPSRRRHSLQHTRTLTSCDADEKFASPQNSPCNPPQKRRSMGTRRRNSGSTSGTLNVVTNDSSNLQSGGQPRLESASITCKGRNDKDESIMTKARFGQFGQGMKNSERIKQFFRRSSGRRSSGLDDSGSIHSEFQPLPDNLPSRQARRRRSLGSYATSSEPAVLQARVESLSGSPLRNSRELLISPNRGTYNTQTIKKPENELKSPHKLRGTLKGSTSASVGMETSFCDKASNNPQICSHRLKSGHTVGGGWAASHEQNSSSNSYKQSSQRHKATSDSLGYESLSYTTSAQQTNTKSLSSRYHRRRSTGRDNHDDNETQKRKSRSPSKGQRSARRRSSIGAAPYNDANGLELSDAILAWENGGSFCEQELDDSRTRSISPFSTGVGLGEGVKIDIRRTEMLMNALEI